MSLPLIVDKPLVCQRGLPGRLSSHCSSIQHGRPTALTSSLVALPASLGSSYRPALRWPGIPGLRSASRCPRPFTPSGLRRQRTVSRTARGLRAPRRRRPSVPALRTALAFGGAVFRRCGRPLGVCSRLQPLRGLQRPATGTGMHFYPQFAIVDPHRTQSVLVALVAHWAYFGLFPPQAAASVRPAKNARNDVHAVISDLSLVLPMLCQCSVAGSKILSLPFYLAIFVFKMRCEAIRMITIDNVIKIYTKGKKHITALKDINLSIPTGSVVGFLGSNGAGKIRRHQAL